MGANPRAVGREEGTGVVSGDRLGSRPDPRLVRRRQRLLLAQKSTAAPRLWAKRAAAEAEQWVRICAKCGFRWKSGGQRAVLWSCEQLAWLCSACFFGPNWEIEEKIAAFDWDQYRYEHGEVQL